MPRNAPAVAVKSWAKRTAPVVVVVAPSVVTLGLDTATYGGLYSERVSSADAVVDALPADSLGVGESVAVADGDDDADAVRVADGLSVAETESESGRVGLAPDSVSEASDIVSAALKVRVEVGGGVIVVDAESLSVSDVLALSLTD